MLILIKHNILKALKGSTEASRFPSGFIFFLGTFDGISISISNSRSNKSK